MSPQDNPGVMSKRAQSIFFAILAIIFIATLITLRVIDVELRWYETYFFIFGTYACMDVLSGRGFVARLLNLFILHQSAPPEEK